MEFGVAYSGDGKGVSSMGSDAKDYDNDGHIDIFSNNLAGQIWEIFHNDGDFFHHVSDQSNIGALSRPFSGWSAGLIDYDNDGWKDLYSANGNVDDVYVNGDARQHDTMFRNIGGKFQDVSAEMRQDFLHVAYQRGSGFGDLNNDGFLVVVMSLMERPRILMNSAGNGNHWLVLELVGTSSSRNAIGAR